MGYIKFEFDQDRFYFVKATSYELDILGFFLAYDITGFISRFKDWAENDKDQYTASNVTQLERRNDNIILNDSLSEEEDGGPFLEIPKQEFIKLLDEWDRICKEKPKEVMIIKEGDTYRVETKN